MTLLQVSQMNEIELIRLAKVSNKENILKLLAQSIYTSVRRCVAKNYNSSEKIINALVNDSAQNVSFFANLNPKCKIKREIKASNPCTLCEVDEEEYVTKCINCPKIIS